MDSKKIWLIVRKSNIWIPVLLFVVILVTGRILDKKFFSGKARHVVHIDSTQVNLLQTKLQVENNRLKTQLDKKYPRTAYLVINSSSNEFTLYKDRKVVRHDMCSTGSYIQLETEDNQKFLFKTPKGEFRIQGKIESPVWRKPDWAFIEEGLLVPSPGHESRYERGVLGDYAMSLGDGYLFHGTLYQRFLGLPVTHGCVRLNDDNLELVYHTLQVGSKVYIF